MQILVRKLRQWRTKVTVVVLGCDPIGLTTVLLSAHSKKTSKIILLEEKSRKYLIGRPQQLALDGHSVRLLRRLQVDFDNIEGCWQEERFCTPMGVLQEYLLSLIQRLDADIEVKLNTKLTKSILDSLCKHKQRTLIVICDSSNPSWATSLSINDEYLQESCKVYGAVASLDRVEQQQIPTPEIRVNRLNVDMSAYGGEFDRLQGCTIITFFLKIFGTLRHRYIALACPKSDSQLLRQLRMTSDSWIMRNIFQESFNAYKLKSEHRMTDNAARSLKCSYRLFDVKLSYRRQNVMYIEEDNLVVTMEGDAARCLNLNSGLGTNLGLRGIEFLPRFIVDIANSDHPLSMMDTLMNRNKQAIKLSEDFIKSGIPNIMYS
uniref:Uncharacterized protein LOC100367641 n=1 Tax=Saccoglossus kowalevskii TaxID=10224 RepID=A0ABM0MX91_SACKO|nr:PREDICTED: uncharacterized protein LOC100367641 [Saccoglossus kowalevskii]